MKWTQGHFQNKYLFWTVSHSALCITYTYVMCRIDIGTYSVMGRRCELQAIQEKFICQNLLTYIYQIPTYV